VAELSEAINLDEIAVGLPRRIHDVTARQVAPDRIALAEDGASWSYRDQDQRVREITAVLSPFGIRAGDFDVLRPDHVVGTLLPGVEGRLRTLDGIPLSKESPGSRVKTTDLIHSIEPWLTAYIPLPKIVIVDVLPGSSTDKSHEPEPVACLHRDRAAAGQAVKFQRRTNLT
jgi:hypothetical protein